MKKVLNLYILNEHLSLYVELLLNSISLKYGNTVRMDE